jgi:hypothetical protein
MGLCRVISMEEEVFGERSREKREEKEKGREEEKEHSVCVIFFSLLRQYLG